ncbi:MAG: 3-deoxy-D-manno-octulosonic acid kinase [Pseudomonadales bacterium]
MTGVKKTYERDGVKVTEFGCSNGATSEYILASSNSTVDPVQLRAALQNMRGKQGGMHDEPNSPGRGSVQRFTMGPLQLIARQYRRGGLVARVATKSYLWTGLKRSRAFRELKVLDFLTRKDVSVCTPEAAWVVRHGPGYQASLLTHYVPNSTTLGQQFANNELTEQTLRDVGRLVRQMHDQSVYHADLNAHNILCSSEGLVLIDFDRGAVRADSGAWMQNNLQRLKRSFEKLATLHNVSLSEQNWQTLINAYESGSGP